mmetsp:Transcript_14756/g.43313  ORF Transcript_14756/g.43313 Transcript_14756/m.43313 type:complete len:233 (+) Transcript_14756:60-758(+)
MGGAYPGFVASLTSSFSMILVTELGDKTFFIAAILAMKHSRALIYTGAMGALGVMTVLAVALGNIAPLLLPKRYTHYAAAILFVGFGLNLLRDAWKMSGNAASEELEEVEAELGGAADEESQPLRGGSSGDATGSRNSLLAAIPAPLIQSFTLTFLAEWGDRSQVATIALAASKEPIGVTIGAVAGHALCTGLAVIGGRMLASSISERTVAVSGGILFLAFAVAAFVYGPDE